MSRVLLWRGSLFYEHHVVVHTKEEPMLKMSAFRELISDGMMELARENLSAYMNELRRRINNAKEELLLAWYAEHGVAPGRAVLVIDGENIMVRQASEEEEKSAREAIDRKAENNGKVCKIVNDRFCWVLIVDGQDIGFQGSSCAEYFAEHYRKLGYTIEWDFDKWNRDDVELRR